MSFKGFIIERVAEFELPTINITVLVIVVIVGVKSWIIKAIDSFVEITEIIDIIEILSFMNHYTLAFIARTHFHKNSCFLFPFPNLWYC